WARYEPRWPARCRPGPWTACAAERARCKAAARGLTAMGRCWPRSPRRPARIRGCWPAWRPPVAEQAEVLIVGAGPAGLAAAVALRRQGIGPVVVTDREPAAGGLPRLCHHTGFGLADLRRVYSGPHYARHYVRHAEQAGAALRAATTITGWQTPTRLAYTSPNG